MLCVTSLTNRFQSRDDVTRSMGRCERPLNVCVPRPTTGSADVEGVTRIGTLIAERLRGLGGSVDLVPPAADRPRITSLPQQFANTLVADGRAGGGRVARSSHPGCPWSS